MKKKRTYQAPLVLTVAALAVTACSTNDDPQTVGAGGTGGSTGGTGGTGGGVGELPACNTAEFYSECQVGALCQYVTDCTSATQETFVFECTDYGTYRSWALATTDLSCDEPYAQCARAGQSGTFTCIESTWLFSGVGGNPPAPCPQTLPEEGSDCYAGAGFGADSTACGYPCAEGDGWTVTGCQSNADQTGSWKGDGACGLGGTAGEGGGAP